MKRSWLRRLFSLARRGARWRWRPGVELLEVRTVPSTINVSGTANADAYVFSVSGGTIRYTFNGGSPINTGVAVGTGVVICVDGQGGNDTIDLALLTSAQYGTATLLGGAGLDTLFGGGGNDLVEGGDGDDSLFGEGGNDVIRGGLGDDAVDGGDKGDEIYGGDGNDSLGGGNGEDWMEGQLGDDTLDGGNNHDYLLGNDGNDLINGGPSYDNVVGGSGNDTLDGSEGNDILDGGPGNDQQQGGDGEDTYFARGAEGEFDSFSDAAGADCLFNVGGGPITLNGFSPTNDINAIDGSGWPVLGNANTNTLDFSGTKFYNVTYVDGGGGTDTITGTAGNDDLRGGSGNDQVRGGFGDDTLYGGAGNDGLSGNLGNDVFVFLSSEGVDTDSVTDFVRPAERLRLIGYLDGQNNPVDFGDLTIAAVAPNTEVTLPNTKKVRLINFNNIITPLSNTDFLFA